MVEELAKEKTSVKQVASRFCAGFMSGVFFDH
jgi:hypothetical protein